MKINTALILCAGFGKRLNPLTLDIPKPLLRLNNITLLETCINTIIKLGFKRIFINTFYLKNKIFNFIKNKNFPIEIQIIDDGKEILNTGGGILNMISLLDDQNYMVFNPDTLWSNNYVNEIKEMKDFYFKKNLNNILLLTKKTLSFDQNFNGDFNLKDNLLKINNDKKYIYIGCQILNKDLFKDYVIENFSISKIWNDLLNKDQLNGFESHNKFYHLTDLKIFKKLQDL
ncbi:NTP transferase domain-containing protein [Pelagibacterales bacterium SAG-MED47]|nr:NTP transferase domain-containing protein [Pelagibacterales bacterium SAG-MED47]